MMIFDFSTDSDLQSWRVVDDRVMGGRSNGNLTINEAGHAVYHGDVSLENNGGFSSIRHRFEAVDATKYSKVLIRLKGDGKRYQFRLKSSQSDRHSYISYMQTTGDWQTVEVQLADLYPTFRGRTLSMPNYPGEVMSEIAFLIGNKETETFQLELDYIQLQ